MTTPNKTSQYGPSPFYPQSVRPRLLVVDDQPANIQALYQIFQTDHEVFMATTGQQALGVCRQVLPDLILLDIMMPDMDGLEVCRQLKADPATTHIPVIFVTGQSEPTDEALALEVGGVDLIHKPVNSCVVRARVQTHLTLKAQAALLRQVTDQVPGMVYQCRLGADGSVCFSYISEGIRKLAGLTPGEVCQEAEKLFALLHPDDKAGFMESMEASATTGQPWRNRFRLCLSGGGLRWFQGNAEVQREADGSCIWHGFVTDVTEEIEVEVKLHSAASVFDSAQESIMITDGDGIIIDVNPAFTRVTGYVRDEVLGQTPKLLKSDCHDVAFYANLWQSLIETGFWRGEVWNRNKGGDILPQLVSIAAIKDATGHIRQYTTIYTDITHLKKKEMLLQREANFDPLTGVYNRRMIADRMRMAITFTVQTQKSMAVCVLDLDDFKPINDSLGHMAGDQVLVEVASRLSACVRENDTVARVGGDEFVLLLLNFDGLKQCHAILKRILESVKLPIYMNGQAAYVSASIGFTLFPLNPSEPEQLLRDADQAMYSAKQAGGGRYQMFDVGIGDGLS